MNLDPDTSVLAGCRARYRCATVADVDAHLRGLTDWLTRMLPKMHPGQRRAAELNYGRDIDRLLNARAMLAALATLDDDLAALGEVTT